LGLVSVPGLGRDYECTGACQGQRVTGTVCCTDDNDMTSGSREDGCAPEMNPALENSHRKTSPHTCTPEHHRLLGNQIQ